MEFLFSPTNELIAVWNGNSLEFYVFRYPGLEFEQSGHSPEISVVIVGGSEWAGRAAWSMDGRLLAYTDAEGLWLLDVYSQFKRLLLPATEEDSPARARYFSDNGRYLAVTIGQTGERYNLDLVTGQQLPDGIFSPNERFLLAYDTALPVSMHSKCVMTQSLPCEDIGMGGDGGWVYENLAAISQCESVQYAYCMTGFSGFGCCAGTRAGDGLGFDFAPVTHSYVIIQSDYEIAVRDGYQSVVRDFRGLVEGQIVTVEWLPSHYMLERTFSQTIIDREQALRAAASAEF